VRFKPASICLVPQRVEDSYRMVRPRLSSKPPVNKEAMHDIIKVALPLFDGTPVMKAKIKNDSSDLFLDELVEGEEILWLGQPDASKLFSGHDIFLIPFTLLWGGFALYWNIGVWTSGSPFFFRLWGLPFLLVGFYLVIGRFLYKQWSKRNTYYAVTNKRLLILSTGFRHNLQAFRLSNLPDLTKSINWDGTGTVTFGKPPARSMWRNNSMNLSNSGMELFGYSLPGFYDIPNANDVYALINELSFSSPDQ
jgi:hypothetical protein